MRLVDYRQSEPLHIVFFFSLAITHPAGTQLEDSLTEERFEAYWAGIEQDREPLQVGFVFGHLVSYFLFFIRPMGHIQCAACVSLLPNHSFILL
jgi:hypothetical protein